MITKAAHPDATIIWGAAFDENMDDEMRVTVIATGFSIDPEKKDQTNTAAAKQPVRKNPQPTTNPKAPAGTGSNINEKNDDDYFDIMTIFGRK